MADNYLSKFSVCKTKYISLRGQVSRAFNTCLLNINNIKFPRKPSRLLVPRKKYSLVNNFFSLLFTNKFSSGQKSQELVFKRVEITPEIKR